MRGHPLQTTLLMHYGTLHNQETWKWSAPPTGQLRVTVLWWVCVCVFGAQTNSTTWLNSIMCFICVSVCVWGLFRYLTQLPPPPPHPDSRGYCENKGWRGYSSGSAYTVFNIFTHVIKRWSGIFTIFSFFTLWRLEGLLEELTYYFLSFYSSLRGGNIRVGSKIFLRKSAHTDYFLPLIKQLYFCNPSFHNKYQKSQLCRERWEEQQP